MSLYKPLTSVIIPVYKTEKYINKCLDSVINQSYSNLEIIIVDDGSPDKSGEIADEYAKKDNRIKIIHKENGGSGSARNAGIKISTGEYLSFIDSDDWLEDNAIENLISEALTKSSEVVMPDRFTKVFSNGKMKKELLFSQYEDIRTLDDFVIDIIVGQGRAWRVSSVLYKSDIIKNNMIIFPVVYTAEDVIFNLKYLSKAKTISFIKHATLNVNKREDSVTASYRNDLPELALYIDKQVNKYITSTNLSREKADIAQNSLLCRNIILFITSELSKKNNKSFSDKFNRIYSVLSIDRVEQAFKSREFIKPYFNSELKVYYIVLMRFLIHHKLKAIAIAVTRVCNALMS